MSTPIVRRYNIITTATWIFEAWEKSERDPDGIGWAHSTITCENGKWYGRIGSRDLPAALEALPYGNERTARVTAWQQAQYEEAYRAIEESGLLEGWTETGRDMGTVTARWDGGTELWTAYSEARERIESAHSAWYDAANAKTVRI